MRATIALMGCLVLVGCGSFSLGYAHAQRGQTQAETDMQILYCSREADLAIKTTGYQVSNFFVGFFFPLMPITYPPLVRSERKTARATFAECMESRGYSVTPP